MEDITIKDIAKICGVGVSTVSRAINNHPDINSQTKEQILKVIRENNYIPNNSARNLKRIEANTIAILVKGIANPFFNNMIKIMEEEIQKRKYSMVLQHVDFNEDEVEVALELILEKRLKGIIFLGGYFNHAETKLMELTVPFVLSTVGGSPEKFERELYSSVSVDDVKEAYKVTKYLIQSGHKKIGILSAPMTDESIGKLRFDGYAKALKEAGLNIDENLVGCMDEGNVDYSMMSGYNLTKEMLEKTEDITAIFAISDNLAIGSCKAIRDFGKRIPEDISVIGFDGIPITEFFNPAITTMAQPIQEMALETISILFDIVKHKEQHRHKVFDAELIVRESTKILK